MTSFYYKKMSLAPSSAVSPPIVQNSYFYSPLPPILKQPPNGPYSPIWYLHLSPSFTIFLNNVSFLHQPLHSPSSFPLTFSPHKSSYFLSLLSISSSQSINPATSPAPSHRPLSPSPSFHQPSPVLPGSPSPYKCSLFLSALCISSPFILFSSVLSLIFPLPVRLHPSSTSSQSILLKREEFRDYSCPGRRRPWLLLISSM